MPTWTLTPAVGPSAPSPTALVTLTAKPTFVVTEFLGTSDSLAWKKQLVKLGFEDATPVYGKRKGVVTFNKQGEKEWRVYQEEVLRSTTAANADWQYLSGHHASHIYSGSIDPDYNKVLNEHDNCGFFNEPYHLGTWSGATNRRDSVYMSASRRPVSAPLAQDENPFMWTNPPTKGVIANACNTFNFRHTRMWLRETFPNAVIFGFFAKTPAGPQAIYPFIGGGNKRGLYQDDAAFWRDPMKRFLNASGAVDDAAVARDLRELNVIYASVTSDHRHSLGMMIQDRCFRWLSGAGKGSALDRVKAGSADAFFYKAKWA